MVFSKYLSGCLLDFLGLEMMHGWQEILNSSCKMCDFAKFCRLRDIQPTRVPQNITVYLDTVSRAK